MTPDFERELSELIEANRERALWSQPRDFTPCTPAAIRRVLDQIAARGDRATFIRARQLLRQMDNHEPARIEPASPGATEPWP